LRWLQYFPPSNFQLFHMAPTFSPSHLHQSPKLKLKKYLITLFFFPNLKLYILSLDHSSLFTPNQNLKFCLFLSLDPKPFLSYCTFSWFCFVDGQPIFVSSNCLPVKALKYDPACHTFHVAALKLLGVIKEDSNKDADTKKVVEDIPFFV
jgi:hypothetical protein